MSLLDDVVSAAKPSLEGLMQDLPAQYLAGLEGTMEGLTGPVKDRVLAHMGLAAEFKFKAIQEADETNRRAYVDGAADEIRQAKTILTSELVAVTNEQAETFAAGFATVLSAVGSAAKAAIGAIASGIASGAISGLVGGAGGGEGGLDLGSVFPGA